MNLPKGVTYHSRQAELIAVDARGIIQIDSRVAGTDGYLINNRHFESAIGPYLRGNWANFDRLFQLNPERTTQAQTSSRVVYSGAEHRGNPKLPNITVIPNLATKDARGLLMPWGVLGCTMGHYHPGSPTDYRIQEVYEFQSYGMMALDYETDDIELWVAQDGDKVAVPNNCHMTLYNLGDENSPLITLDFADPERNPADKFLVGKYGPVLLVYYNDVEVVFSLNRLHINNPDHRAGVRLSHTPSEERQRQVSIARAGRLALGPLLHEQLTQNLDVVGQMARLGIRIKPASPETFLESRLQASGSRLYFSRPLVEATREGSDVYNYFMPPDRKGKQLV